MTRQTTEQTACDVCGQPGPVESATVVFRGVTVIVDLCRSDTRRLEELTAKGSSRPRTRSPGDRARTPAHRVVPID